MARRPRHRTPGKFPSRNRRRTKMEQQRLTCSMAWKPDTVVCRLRLRGATSRSSHSHRRRGVGPQAQTIQVSSHRPARITFEETRYRVESVGPAPPAPAPRPRSCAPGRRWFTNDFWAVMWTPATISLRPRHQRQKAPVGLFPDASVDKCRPAAVSLSVSATISILAGPRDHRRGADMRSDKPSPQRRVSFRRAPMTAANVRGQRRTPHFSPGNASAQKPMRTSAIHRIR